MDPDVFISYASEDKSDVAVPLAQSLRELGISVWIDEFSITLGDSIVRAIDQGLRSARLGIVILSPSFFSKQWTQRELDALLAREAESGDRLLIPVWHQVGAEDVRNFSPLLADRLAISTTRGIEEVAKAIAQALVLRTESASEALERRISSTRGTPPPVSTRDEGKGEWSPPDEIFLVHGHDLAARETVARFLERVGTRPVVLNELPSGGSTIIEKLEQYSNVKFAVVLLTPDDVGSSIADQAELRRRARQNVLIELGYFIGRLGRNRFCILRREDVELPSDIHGLVCIELDQTNGWQLYLAKELRRAGIRLDLNRLLD